MKLKICGMKYNTNDVAALKPDYLGFIFWKPSKRYHAGQPSSLSDSIKRVGVFVDSSLNEIIAHTKQHTLDLIQLHGNEDVKFCANLKNKLDDFPRNIEIIKMFSVNDSFNFEVLNSFENFCDYFLFDTKGKLPGGNGFAFNWKLLQQYPSSKPYFLSGGIGPESFEKLKEFVNSPQATYCHAIDINSKFETEPGRKHIESLKEFISKLSQEHILDAN